MIRAAKRRIVRAKGRAEAKRQRPLIAAALPPEDMQRLMKAEPGQIVWLSREATDVIIAPRNRRPRVQHQQ